MTVRPKKQLGQHFLNDTAVCRQIADSLTGHQGYHQLVEIGPGMGALTGYLLDKSEFNLHVVEIDDESVQYLISHFPFTADRIVRGDFLKLNLQESFKTPMGIIGNFPYNISSQILFKVWDNHEDVCEVVGMFQKEVAMRIAHAPGSRDYGILSVLMQTFYDVEYLFTVEPHYFNPPPKIDSGVIRLRRNKRKDLPCDKKFFQQVVKTAFNQRRKTLRNTLKSYTKPLGLDTSDEVFGKRPEQLDVEAFLKVATTIEEAMSKSS